MTYIAAFRCIDGIVMCADTQETVGEHKQYAEKITVAGRSAYPIAIGGAGAGELIEAMTQEIFEALHREAPPTHDDFVRLVAKALNEVFAHDLSALVIPKQLRAPQLLIAARLPEGTQLTGPRTCSRRSSPPVSASTRRPHG